MSGEPIDADYATRRMRWEPLFEVTQIKGDGEAHPLLSLNDEFGDFYKRDKGDFGFNAKTPDMLPGEYARSGLRRGLEIAAETGVNPCKFGMVGSIDSHTSLARVMRAEYQWAATCRRHRIGGRRQDSWFGHCVIRTERTSIAFRL